MNAPQQGFRRRADHIALIVQSLSGGGVQMRMLALAREFARRGRRVDLFVGERDRHRAESLPRSVRVTRLGRDRARDLAQHLRADPPDVVLSGGTPVHRVAVAASDSVPEVPLVLRASGHPSRRIPWTKWRARLVEAIKRPLRDRRYRKASLVIAVSDDTASAVRRIAPETPVITLPSPVVSADFEAKAAARIEHAWVDDDVPIILSVGRLTPSKDYPGLLSAFAILRRSRHARLVILGGGSAAMRQQLIDTARRLGVEGDVALLGWRQDVPAWLERADLLVLASWWEGCPASIIEAMAAGCPVVATDCPGDSRSLLRDGELGGLVPVRDPRAMAAAMARQLDDPVDSNRLRAAAERYREDKAAAAYLKALDQLAAQVD
ncbi:MAG: glycosyltransferase [Pseudomonadota bacterium]